MSERIDRFDWATTPLGPQADWPSELKIITRQILDSSFPKAVIWGPQLTTIHNDAFLPILRGKADALGRSFADIWSEVWPDIEPIVKRAFAGTPTYIEDFPLVIHRSGGPEQAWFTFCYSPLRLADGTIAGMLDTVIETSNTVRAQADLAAVNQELAHRLKNTLAVVQGIAFQTLRHATPAAALDAFGERLTALGHAHDILLRQGWSAVSLRRVISDSLAPHDGLGQIDLEGPDCPIGSHATLALSLMLNELATNAVKYGALSCPEGRIRLLWTIEDGMFRLAWEESGGPEIAGPGQSGFGSRLIDRGLGSRSDVVRRYAPTGFSLKMRAPLEEITA
ncbi:sensor histidine kinase [Sphingobium lignivorans]|uniref:histidine kinase n=1 Tax=Sphingobium lignivorans TaxID=2735886 RepID=A0ABR6NBU9_9SPHN|nr:PAS domain-containing sensor histidine kinase [Sphingobium lignivorans]MBB5984142.1 two-component sensor histidine kinase [Sphingobium lignivorans]